jgi:hypothetical protein
VRTRAQSVPQFCVPLDWRRCPGGVRIIDHRQQQEQQQQQQQYPARLQAAGRHAPATFLDPHLFGTHSLSQPSGHKRIECLLHEPDR